MKHTVTPATTNAGLFTLALRLVTGYTYFSALWRRIVLTDKLNPEGAKYIGEKFNHFLPNALGIKPIIEYLVTHPEALWWNMLLFTLIEGIVGLCIMLGLFTRLMSIGVSLLALGILLGSGWLGTTCLDEWQIGILGIASGFTLWFTGSGPYSIDYYFLKKHYKFSTTKWFSLLGSGTLPIGRTKPFVLAGSMLILFVTLFTNQYFHGGVWGTLHNKSVKPKLELSNGHISNTHLSFEIYRTEGADVYGAFVIGITISDINGNTLKHFNGDNLAELEPSEINNKYITKIKPGKHSLVVPLGAKGTLSLPTEDIAPTDAYTVKVTDISGLEWMLTLQ
ncbi:TQO small subunit DoxD [Neptunitalea lumnitzerae]|uniref:Quinol oxidase n=1 Tax=Neptunitalea lumnitzerae TaxID=2965509 RepID=A0ABQ5MEN1_9FLAO|nr:TQO small subunit DoxD [Neptunitalea sp. Y10]GLB47833.1 quinol oxidase [Neptunitalea sp. Y10]